MVSGAAAGEADCLSRKVVVVGDSGVGKTALLLRFVSDTYNDMQASGTIGGTFLAKKILVDGNFINLKIWDTAGQERFRSIVKMYYRRAAVALLCCDLADENSYKSLPRWVSELREVLGDKVLLEVVITKTDLQREPRVPREVVEAYAKSLHPNTSVTDTSAKTRDGVDMLFQKVGRRILNEVTLPITDDLDDRELPAVGLARARCSC